MSTEYWKISKEEKLLKQQSRAYKSHSYKGNCPKRPSWNNTHNFIKALSLGKWNKKKQLLNFT